MGRKAKKEAAPEDIYIEERGELALEFSKIALAGILSHEGSNGWPTPAIASRAGSIGFEMACQFYPVPSKPKNGVEATFMEQAGKTDVARQ